MYRTDKQFMTNPATNSSRIYIGSLPKTVVASDLEEKFQAHGKILGMVVQMGFAFIQYENENQAHAAIQNECNATLHGRKIIVKQALDKSQKGPNNNAMNRWPGGPPGPMQQGPRPPFGKPMDQMPPQRPPMLPRPQQPMQRPPPQGPPQQPPLQRPPPQKMPEVEPEPKKVPPVGPVPPNIPKNIPPNMDEEMNEGPPDMRGRKRRMHSRERFGPDHFNEPFYGREEFPPTSYERNRPPVIDQQPDRNDCEIIVVSKQLTKYAEYVEQRLKSLGLIVDLLFPNEDVPIGRVLANISSRGCLYAILIMPQNEEHRSLTLNILHGLPQEHRNMPIDDALILMTRNFDAYMRGDKTTKETSGQSGVMTVSDRHPTSIQLMLNLLAENRQLTSSQYDKLLKYLQERREVQEKHEVDEGVDLESKEPNTKQAELQSRIMNILNKTATESPVPAPEPTPPAPAPGDAPLLKDPTVQKALDSLLGGEMFKNIAGF